jgi:hypothetical protein
MRHTT